MDINEKIEANLGLVYQQLIRFNLTDDQDAESYAYEALYRAIITYDESAGTAFSTYAICVISNTLRMHIRKINRKRQLDIISYDVTVSDEDSTGALVDTLAQAEDTESTVLFNELNGAVSEAFLKTYNSLSEMHKKIIFMWYESDYKLTQSEIAKSLHLSQPSVSKALSNFKYKLKLELEEYM